MDAHFHLDLFREPTRVIAECESREIVTIAVTNAPSVFFHTQRLAASSRLIHAAVGLHPELVATHKRELPELLRLIGETRFVGEVGLDFTTSDPMIREQQTAVFLAILARAAEFRDRVITVHSRRAAGAVLDCIGADYPGTVILHWFSGSKRDLGRAVAAGCYFSVNPAMTRSERGSELVAEMPRERILTETDGPFVEVDGRALTPLDVTVAIEGIARVWDVDSADVKAAVLRNWESITSADR